MRPTIKQVQVSDLLALRHRVLRSGMPMDSARFDGDDASHTLHLAALAHETDSEAVVGCLSLMREAWDGADGWRLRGMAVAETHRGRGVGAALLEAADRFVREQATDGGPGLLWCNARTPAVGFYQRQGWSVTGDEFEEPSAGPHYRMWKRV